MSIFPSRDQWHTLENICYSFRMLHCRRMPWDCKYSILNLIPQDLQLRIQNIVRPVIPTKSPRWVSKISLRIFLNILFALRIPVCHWSSSELLNISAILLVCGFVSVVDNMHVFEIWTYRACTRVPTFISNIGVPRNVRNAKSENMTSSGENDLNIREKGRHLTQSYENSPFYGGWFVPFRLFVYFAAT